VTRVDREVALKRAEEARLARLKVVPITKTINVVNEDPPVGGELLKDSIPHAGEAYDFVLSITPQRKKAYEVMIGIESMAGAIKAFRVIVFNGHASCTDRVQCGTSDKVFVYTFDTIQGLTSVSLSYTMRVME
jgi:hypothetical protein